MPLTSNDFKSKYRFEVEDMAPKANELFSLSAASPNDVPLHGEAIVRGTGDLRADFRRGIDLSAGFDVRAEASFTAVAEFIRATFAGGVAVRGGIALQAAFPLDLFNEAGIVARLRAQIEASAFLRASISLEMAAFRQLVVDALPGPALQELLSIFFDELEVGAGVWGRVAFTAEILGEAYLTGSLLPTADHGPGFSFSMRYAVGFYYGTGFDFVANFGIKDPHRLTDRMASALAGRAISEAESFLATLPQAEADIARAALVPLRIILPLAIRVPLQLGFELAHVIPTEQAGIAAVSALSTLARSALDLVLNAGLDWAVEEMRRLLAGDAIVRSLIDLAESERVRAQQIRTDAIACATRLADIPLANMRAWLPELVTLLGLLEELIGLLPMASDADLRPLRHALAVAWACGNLVARLQAWMADENRRVAALFQAVSVIESAPAGGSVGSYVLERLGRPSGTALTLVELVDFLLGVDLEAAIRAAVPALGSTLDWLAGALGLTAAEIVARLFRGLAEPTRAEATAFLATVAPAVGNAVAQQVAPLFTQMKAAAPGNEALAIVLDELVAPSLAALPQVFLPQIANLGTPEAGRRFREALSSVALQTLVRFLVASTDALLAHGMREGEAALGRLGPEILAEAEAHPIYALLASAASRAIIPGGMTPREASELTVLAGNVLGILKDAPRQGIADAIRIAAALGFATEATRNVTFGTLVGSDDPPDVDDLLAALDRVKNGMGDVATLAVPQLLRIIALRPLREVEVVVRFVQEAAAQAIAGLQQAVVWLAEQLNDLNRRFTQLMQDIVAAGVRITAQVEAIANAMLTLVDNFVEQVRLYGRDIVVSLTNGLGPLQGAALGLYDLAFQAVRELLDAPLRLLAEIAGSIREALTIAVEGGSHTRQGVDDAVRFRIRSSPAASLRMPIRVTIDTPLGEVTLLDLGTVTISAAPVMRILEGLVFGHPTYSASVDSAVADNNTRLTLQTQAALTSQAIASTINQQNAQQQVGDLVPGTPLRIEILSPADGEIGRPWVNLTIRIFGINRTHLAPTLGVPRRVVMTLNGLEQDFLPSAWQQRVEENGEVHYDYFVRVVPFATPQPVAAPGPVVISRKQFSLDPNLVAVLTPGDTQRVRFARASARKELQTAPEFVGEIGGTAAATMWAAAREALPRQGSGDPMFIPVRLAAEAVVTTEPCACHDTPTQLVLRDTRSPGTPVNRLDLFAPDIDRELGWLHRGRFGCNMLAVGVTDGIGQSPPAQVRVFFLGGAPR